MRLSSLGLAFVGSLAVLPLACSSGDRPQVSEPDDRTKIDGGRVGTDGGDTDEDAGDGGLVQGEPASIAHLSTICGTIACGIMGIKRSGFQELADVSFVVKDSVGKPVSGVEVTFELESPPQGTEFLDPGNGGGGATVKIKTDAAGKATAKVQSGVTLGVFSVMATVNAGLQAKSPAIGVRGVTPANRGFTLQCGLKNLAAYADALPPKPLKTTCTATLVDRFNNPVGKPTTINLKVEAGAIPSSVQSTPFNATGANPDEGKATVEFNTVGTFPALDVAPMAGEASLGSLNQRDGLVTVLAYVAGEEAFDDNNSNGQWDAGENFIDQGEPFVDSNDNNQWDPGEFYADVAPSNGKYDPPNMIWDKQTTIWTTTFILYSGLMSRSRIADDSGPVAAVNVPIGATKKVYASFADDRFNPPQAGAVTTFAFARSGGTRGGATAANEGVLDGYGFALSRALYDADNPSEGCSATVARCQWLTKFSFASTGFTLGTTATLTGAAGAPAASNQELTFTATVHGTKVEHKIGALFE
jgi:hypothetical protein